MAKKIHLEPKKRVKKSKKVEPKLSSSKKIIMDIGNTIEDKLKHLDNHDLYDLCESIDIEDNEHPDLNHYERDQMFDEVIIPWVENGIKHKFWTLDEWLNEILENYPNE